MPLPRSVRGRIGSVSLALAACALLLWAVLPESDSRVLEAPSSVSAEAPHPPRSDGPAAQEPSARPSSGSGVARLPVDAEREAAAWEAAGRVTLPDATPAGEERVEFLRPPRIESSRRTPMASGEIFFATQTDAQGEFRAALDPAGSYAVRVVPRDPRLGTAVCPPKILDRFLSIRLEPASELRGRVTLDGRPLAGVPVRLARQREYPRWIHSECRTDVGGNYSLARLTAGDHVVEALPAGAPRAAAILTWATGQVSIHDFSIVSGEVLRGRVLDREGRAPSSGAEVALRSDMRQAARARADGSFEIALGPDVAYPIVVYAKAPGYADAQKHLAEYPKDGVEILLEHGVRVRGRVLAADAGGLPLSGAEVLAAARTTGHEERVDLHRSFADSAGHFILEGVARDLEHVLIVRMAGYGTHLSELGLAAAEPELDLGTIALDPAAALGGRVVNAEGNGLEGFEIRVRRIQPALPAAWKGIEGWLSYAEVTVTSPGGSFSLDDLGAGTYLVLAEWPGVERSWRASSEVLLEAGRRVEDVNFVMDEAASIAGRVVGPEGEAVRGAFLTLATRGDDSRPVASLATNQDGAFRFDGILPGTYEVNVQIEPAALLGEFGPRPAGASFDVTLGSESLELVLPEAASISGFVLDANEEMIAHVFVMAVVDGYQTVDSTMTDEGGAFTLTYVAGVVDLAACASVEHPEHGGRVPDRTLGHVRLPGVAAGSTGVILRLPTVLGEPR